MERGVAVDSQLPSLVETSLAAERLSVERPEATKVVAAASVGEAPRARVPNRPGWNRRLGSVLTA